MRSCDMYDKKILGQRETVARDRFPAVDDIAIEQRSEEVWKDITGYPGHQISSLGRVRSRIVMVRDSKTGKLSSALGNDYRPMAPQVIGGKETSSGRYSVRLSWKNKGRSHKIHLLVLEAFVGPRPVGCVGCHNNDNHFDNRLVNLRWDTPRSNWDDTVRNGGLRATSVSSKTKTTVDQVREIRHLASLGISQTDLVRRFGLSRAGVSQIIHGENWNYIESDEYAPIQPTSPRPYRARITEEDVVSMRAMYENGASIREIIDAIDGKCGYSYAYKIVRKRAWQHVQ